MPHPAFPEFVPGRGTAEVTLPKEDDRLITPFITASQNPACCRDAGKKTQKADPVHFGLWPPILIVGPQYTMVNISVTSRINAVKIEFHPGRMQCILVTPKSILFDNTCNAFGVLGAEMEFINEQLLNTSDIEVRTSIVERLFREKRTQLQPGLPFDAAVSLLLQQGGNIAIQKLALLACLSLRQFERKCVERIGVLPKVFARIVRFSKAYRLKEANQNISWTAIAHEIGYFDQMHFIRDFKEFAGVTPRCIERPA